MRQGPAPPDLMNPPNKPDAANSAIALSFHAGRQWRGVADPCRSK
jgi:hypothetical protein